MNQTMATTGLLLAGLAGSVAADDAALRPPGHEVIGTVYTMSNAASGNDILLFDRDRRGRLRPGGAVSTEGLGTGTGLGNQNALILDPAHRWLFAVNAGSDDISVFAVHADGLELIEREPANGVRPISLAYARNLLYVLNAGGNAADSDHITGFTVGADGGLTPLPGSTRTLSAATTDPAQIQFNADGDVLVVTEKATNNIVTFTVDRAGLAGDAQVTPSVGTTPFGFAFGLRDQLLVSEAAAGAQDQSAVSSYRVGEDGTVTPISPSVGTTETAACWVVVSADGRFAYTTNAGSGSISGYRVGFDGSLTLLDANGRTGLTGPDSAPIDMALSNDGRNLYALNSGNGSISAFRIRPDGGLAGGRLQTGLPLGANGLAAR